MKLIAEHSTIPVVKHDAGVCHIYVDADADPAMAETICVNAKAQRPSTCNAMETLLVHQSIARTLLPKLAASLTAAKVEIRGCPKTCQLIPEAKPASGQDYGKEFLDLILAVKVVKNMDEALEHIAQYGSRHTEAIITSDYGRAMRFLKEVDASAVLVNASTRLNDGYQFGLGAEIGISTSRIHARGPMGLEVYRAGDRPDPRVDAFRPHRVRTRDPRSSPVSFQSRARFNVPCSRRLRRALTHRASRILSSGRAAVSGYRSIRSSAP
jgi:glutamate-5-semialdehyde dehydrogenase